MRGTAVALLGLVLLGLVALGSAGCGKYGPPERVLPQSAPATAPTGEPDDKDKHKDTDTSQRAFPDFARGGLPA